MDRVEDEWEKLAERFLKARSDNRVKDESFFLEQNIDSLFEWFPKALNKLGIIENVEWHGNGEVFHRNLNARSSQSC